MKHTLTAKQKYEAGMAALFLACGCYAVCRTGSLIMLPDEFGYWAGAATFCGLDWSGVSSLHSWYSFGYSLVLTPLFALLRDPRALVKSAVALQYFFLFLHAVLLRRVCGRLLPGASGGTLNAVCAAASCYSALIAYASLNMTEVLLNLLFLCAVWLIGETLRRGGWLRMGAAALCLAYAYTVHMRTFAVLAAGGVCLLAGLLRRKQERRRLIALALFAAALSLAYVLARGGLRDRLYGMTREDMLAWNSLRGQLARLGTLVTKDGMLAVLGGIVGKLFYLGNATFFTFYWGMAFLVRKLRRLWKEGRAADAESLEAAFLLLSAVGTILLSALYLSGGEGRIDSVLYGRYNELFVPVLIALGLAEMLRTGRLKEAAAGFLLFHCAAVWVIEALIRAQHLTMYEGYMAIGISFLLRPYDPPVAAITRLPLLVCGLCGVLLTALMAAVRRGRVPIRALYLMAALHVLIGFVSAELYFYPHSADNAYDLELGEKIAQEFASRAPGQDGSLYYFHLPGTEYIDNIQFALRERPVRILTEADALTPRDMVILYMDEERGLAPGEELWLAQRYDRVLKNGRFRVYYNSRQALVRAEG